MDENLKEKKSNVPGAANELKEEGEVKENNNAENDTSSEEKKNQQESTEMDCSDLTKETETERKIRKRIPIIIGTLAVVAAIVMGVYKFAGKSQDLGIIVPLELTACLDENQIAYVPRMDGGVAEFEDASEAYITPDRKHIVVISNDEGIFVTDTDQKNKTYVADDGSSVKIIKDKGFIYKEFNGEYHRYLFSDGSDVTLGRATELMASTEDLNVAFAKDKTVYLLKSSSEEVEKLGSFDDDCKILSVSNDGETIYWDDYNNNEERIFAYTKEEKTKVGTFDKDTEYPGTNMVQSATQSYAVIFNSQADELFVVQDSEEPIKVKLGDNIDSNVFYTVSDLIQNDTNSKFTGIYVRVAGEEGSNLYYIDEAGKRNKVISDVGEYTISNGKLFYVDKDDNMKSAKLSKDSVTKEEKIAGDVEIVLPGCINGYVYFVKDISSKDMTGSLYVSKNGDKPKKISSEASVSVYEVIDFRMLNATASLDGKTIYYYKDVEEISDTYTEKGDLYKYTYGSDESKKIASEVILYTQDSGVSYGINNKSFIYKVYSSKSKNDDILVDWYYFNGSESNIMASEVLR